MLALIRFNKHIDRYHFTVINGFLFLPCTCPRLESEIRWYVYSIQSKHAHSAIIPHKTYSAFAFVLLFFRWFRFDFAGFFFVFVSSSSNIKLILYRFYTKIKVIAIIIIEMTFKKEQNGAFWMLGSSWDFYTPYKFRSALSMWTAAALG